MATNLSSNISGVPCPYMFVDVMVVAWSVLYLLLTPLFLYVLYQGYRQTKTSPPSHSDVFTFHVIGTEVTATIGSFIVMVTDRNEAHIAALIGGSLYQIGVAGQMCIHCLTCVERYLAVVHPITYLHLKKRGGVMIRDISIIWAWIFSIATTSLQHILTVPGYSQLYFCFLFLPMALVLFCSVSVLFVLIRPKPGAGGGGRVDQSKRRAFITISVIMGVLLIRFVYFTVAFSVNMLEILSRYKTCLVSYASPFTNIPSSLVLPLMFLQKAKKLPKCFMS